MFSTIAKLARFSSIRTYTHRNYTPTMAREDNKRKGKSILYIKLSKCGLYLLYGYFTTIRI